MVVRRTARSGGKKQPTPITLGFIGSGEVSEENVDALLNDFVDGKEPIFVVPVTKDHWNNNLALVVNYAKANDIPYDVVVNDDTATMKNVKSILSGAVKQHKIKNVTAKLVNLLADLPSPSLITLWDDGEETSDAADKAMDAQIDVLDLTNGLEAVEFEEPEAGEGGDADETEEEPADDAPYTREELEAMDIDELKAICKENNIEVPARSRAPRYVDAILEASEDEPEAAGEDEPEEDAKPAKASSNGKVTSNGAVAEILVGASLSFACPHCENSVEIGLPLVSA